MNRLLFSNISLQKVEKHNYWHRCMLGRGFIFVYLLVILFPFFLQAQETTSELRFENLSIYQGMSQSSALAMVQDRKGFLWVGTADGLNRYDGYKFKVYRKTFLDSTTLGSNYINALAEDTTGNIWVGTRYGLYSFDWKTENFTKFLPDSLHIDPNHIISLVIDKQNKVWVGTIVGLYVYDQDTQKFTKLFPHKKFEKGGYQIISSMSLDSKGGYMWLGTEYGLFRYNIHLNTYEHYLHNDKDSTSIIDNKISALFPDDDGNMWAGTYNGYICKWYRTNSKFLNLKLPTNSTQPYGANKVKAFCKTIEKSFWVGTMNTGLYFVRNLNEKYSFKNFCRQIGNPLSLSDNDVVSLLEDVNGIFWVGTFGGGINKNDKRQMFFNHYKHNFANIEGLGQKGIRAITEDSKNNLWIGYSNYGLSKFDNTNQTYKNYEHIANNPFTISSNKINTVIEDSQGVIWAGAAEGGLNRLEVIKDSKTGKEKEIFVRYSNQKNTNIPSLAGNTVYIVKEDAQHYLWIGTRTGLSVLSPDRKTFKNYLANPKDKNAITNEAVRAIFFDDDNDRVWIGTFEGGVSVFDRKTEKFTTFKRTPNCKNCLSENAVSSIYVDYYGTVWIGTFGGGLNKLDMKTGKFTHITENEGLANNVIYGILEDGANHLWLSTNRGISRYDIISGLTIGYNVKDGLQSDEFNANAYHKGRSGNFYFGGINGLTSFRPDSLQIKYAHKPYSLLLTDFRIFNKSVKPSAEGVLTESITTATTIRLSSKDYVFAFEFASLNLSTPHRIRYAYKLQGFDTEWIYTNSDDRVANYSNIPAGTYIFSVKATNDEGAWTDKYTNITLIIEPPFWNTSWFKLLVFLLIGIALATFYQYRMASAKKYQKELEREVTIKTSELTQQNEEILQQRDIISLQLQTIQESEQALAELNASKDKFFSILAHDLRSPLNSLSGFSSLLANFADQMTPEEIKQIAQDLEKNVKTSTKYLENLLTWARSQMNSIEFKPENLDFATCVKTSIELLQTQADSKHIQIQTNIESNLKVFADTNQLQTILTNLIANAIKFTNINGIVKIEAKNNQDGFAWIEVIDTGVGMSESVMNKIFRIDAKHSTKGTEGEAGTGLGLLLCKEFVEKNSGIIGVKSVEQEGTTFYFTLPIVTT